MKLLALDGNSIINRAFYGVRPLTTRDGRPTHAVFGFMTMFNKILADEKPDAVAFAFDMRAPTFRHKKYAEYKGKRKGMPDELASQMQPLKDILTALGYKIVTAEGWEADDILGTLARASRERGDECVIATGDRDTLQLVGGGVSVRLLATKEGRPTATNYDTEAIKEAYGVSPEQLKDIKAIQGDTSDNIPGVPGIGEKGARDLITKFGSLDGVYENIDSPDIKAGMRKKLIEGKESAYLSYWLGTVQCDAPVPTDADAYIPAPADAFRVRMLMTDLELFSLLKKMDLPETGADGTVPRSVAARDGESGKPDEKDEISLRFSDAEECIALIKQRGSADLLFRLDGDVSGGQYAPAGSDCAAYCAPDGIYTVRGAEAFALFSAVAGDGSIKKRTHGLKALASAALSCGIHPEGFVLDTMLAAYLINPSANDYSLDRLTGQYLGLSETSVPPFAAFAADALRFSTLCGCLDKKLEELGLVPLLRDVELPLAVVLADMELCGFMVDSEGIRAFGGEIMERAGILEKEIYEDVGYEFNINSPKQLGDALFVKLSLPGGKKTKTGWSTGAEILDNLRGVHPVIEKILEYRMLAKLDSTYCKGLLKCVAADGRIHTCFNQTETRTGRISSAEPNLQNIPVRTELGRELRRFFVAPEGMTLIDADYSQIELRVLAHMAHDETMIKAFADGTDIHRVTASQVFGMPEELVTPKLRSNAKAVNFGIVYGISAFSLGKDIGVSTKEAQRYINGYLATYSGVARFMKETVEQAKKDGYVQTMYGRRRYLPELAASNFSVRSFGERVARNMPIQGTAADIIKLAMVRVYERLRREGLKTRLIMQVHDELILEAPEEEAGRAAALLTEEMSGAADLAVKLVVDTHSGKTWLDAK